METSIKRLGLSDPVCISRGRREGSLIIVVMAKGGFFFEKLRRCVRTVFFMVAMVVSLLVSSLPLLVALGDVLVPFVLISSFTCVRCYGFNEHLHRYAFKSSLTDIPLVSVVRSIIIICTILCSSFSFLRLAFSLLSFL